MKRRAAIASLFAVAAVALGADTPRSIRLPDADLHKPVIWSSTSQTPDGKNYLSFGGQDQEADDGLWHTHIKDADGVRSIEADLRKTNPLQPLCERARTLRNTQKNSAARARAIFLDGHTDADEAKLIAAQVLAPERELAEKLAALQSEFKSNTKQSQHVLDQAKAATAQLTLAAAQITPLLETTNLSADTVIRFSRIQIPLEEAVACLDAEPQPRALSPIVYDAKSNLFILFAGDHLDYLTNDTWAFDPATKSWIQRHPESAPPPRANHTLKSTGDGKIILTGGYTYTSNLDYVGGQYRELNDGDWTYDIAASTWTGTGKSVPPESRTYRTGPLHPDFFLQGPKPDAAVFDKWLGSVPANTWTLTNPPQLPKLNRDWGTAVLDPDHNLILRWSGGHSAHGGTDVLHYHIATNRWELSAPVEFPLGQLYSNTSYPDGWNFNHRPWITGHTYQSYGYDILARRMVFVGRKNHSYIYDPEIADWTVREAKPPGMAYGDCYYSLNVTSTPQGLVAWTNEGKLFNFKATNNQWTALATTGTKLPGSSTDNSTLTYDSKRNRLLFARKDYGDKIKFSGQLFAVDLKTLEASALTPAGAEIGAAVPYVCQLRYDPDNDLILVGGTLAPNNDGTRLTPAYDCIKNEWVTLALTGEDPSGKPGRNVSLGMMYDTRQKLFWAVDTNSKVYVLKLNYSR